jgi:hypothetical protein
MADTKPPVIEDQEKLLGEQSLNSEVNISVQKKKKKKKKAILHVIESEF